MKITKIIIGIFLAVGLLTTPALAQEDSVDEVLIASEANYPDALMGSAVSEKLGIPLIITESDQLPEEAEEALEEYGPEDVVVLGGPAVVSESVFEELEENHDATRLWGMSRYGTAEEIVDRYWPEGTESAVLVEEDLEDERGSVMANARSFAGERPVLPVPEGKIPSGVLNQLNEMDVEEVDFVGTEISEEMEEDLEDIGAGTGEEVTAQDRDEIAENARERAKENVQEGDRLLVVAHRGRTDVISAPSAPDRRPIFIGDEEDIDDLVETVEDKEIEEVKIAGNPELAGQAAEALKEIEDVEVDNVVDRATTAVEQASTVARENRPDFAGKYQERSEDWRQQIEDRSERVEERASRDLERARGIAEDIENEEIQGMVDEAEQAIEDGDFGKARDIARDIRSEARSLRYEEVRENPEEIAREVRRDQESLRERAQELRELNEEFGDMMQEDMTVDERLSTIEGFRERRHEHIQGMIDQAVENGGLHNITGFRDGPGRPEDVGPGNNR